MDCIKLCANGKAHYQVVLTQSIVGRVDYRPANLFEVAKLINYTNEWHVDLKYNERADFTNRYITFITQRDFFDLLEDFGDHFSVSYKRLREDLFNE